LIDELVVDGDDDMPAGGDDPDERTLRAEARAAHAEERLRTRALHVGQLEHRLKTALGVISGWAWSLESLWDRFSDDERRAAVSTSRRRADVAIGDAEQLLREVRAEITSLDLDPVEIDLAEALRVSAHTYSGTSVCHDVRYEGPDGVLITADPAALQQVLGQLLENAIKYSPDGGGVVLAAARAEGAVVVEVRDEGIGLPEGIDIFGAFERGPVPAGQPGTGLGLYIVRSLVQTMGGAVAARGNPGAGATFTITLPA